MDLSLKALCREVLCGNVDSERFALLLMETGINLDSYEWDVANSLLRKGDEIASLSKRLGETLQ